jgi:ABC-2 type transport system permease protein
MKRFWAIFKKEFRQILRDPLSLAMLIFVPAMLLVLYGYALSFDVKHIRVAVLDEDCSQESRRLMDSMFQNPYFDRAGTLTRREEADDLLNRGMVRAVMIIPPDYSKRLQRGEEIEVQALIDGADATTASTTVGYLDLLADRLTRQAQMEYSVPKKAARIPSVVPEPRIWFNPNLDSAHFLVPGLIGMLLMLSAVVATSLSIVREKERETMEQIMVSPVKPEELILGKTLPYVAICLVTVAMILLLGYLLFGIAVRGSWLMLGISTLLFLFAALGMGVLISAVNKSQQMAFQVAIISSLLPSIILSGLIFPLKNMPLIVQGLSFLVIPRYYVAALRGIILKDAPLSALWPQWVGMLILGVLFNILAAKMTRKTI